MRVRSDELAGGVSFLIAAYGLLGQAGLPAGSLGGWETILAFAPQLVLAVGAFFMLKWAIDIFRGDIKTLVANIAAENETRDKANREALVKFENALKDTNEANKEGINEVAKQLQLATQQDREQNAKMFDAIFGLTREAVMKMGALESTVRSLEQEVRSDRRGSALPSPDPTFPKDRPKNGDDSGRPRTGP